MLKAWLPFVLIVLVLVVGTPGQGLTREQRKDPRDSLVELVQKMMHDLRDRNADALIGAYGRRDEFVHIDNGKAVPWAQLEPQIRTYLSNVKKNEVYWVGTPKVLLLGPDAAVVHGTHRFDGDGTRESHTGEWTGVFQRINGTWKVVHSHSSDAGH